MGFSEQTVKVSIERPKVRDSKRCASMTDQFEAAIRTFSYQMESDKSLKNKNPTWVNHLSKMRAVKGRVIYCQPGVYVCVWGGGGGGRGGVTFSCDVKII